MWSVPSSLLSRASAFLLVTLALSAIAPGAQAAGGERLGRGVQVVGSGHLNATVTVRSAPRSNARRVTVLREFPVRLSPAGRLGAVQAQRSRHREAGLVPRQRSGPPERPHRVDSSGCCRSTADAPGDLHRPQRTPSRSLEPWATCPEDHSCRRCTGNGDPAGALLRHLEVRPNGARPGPLRLRDERLLAAVGLAREAALSESTERLSPGCSARLCPTGACASRTATSSAWQDSSASARRYGSSPSPCAATDRNSGIDTLTPLRGCSSVG